MQICLAESFKYWERTHKNKTKLNKYLPQNKKNRSLINLGCILCQTNK